MGLRNATSMPTVKTPVKVEGQQHKGLRDGVKPPTKTPTTPNSNSARSLLGGNRSRPTVVGPVSRGKQ